jgi:hypothetical protein
MQNENEEDKKENNKDLSLYNYNMMFNRIGNYNKDDDNINFDTNLINDIDLRNFDPKRYEYYTNLIKIYNENPTILYNLLNKFNSIKYMKDKEKKIIKKIYDYAKNFEKENSSTTETSNVQRTEKDWKENFIEKLAEEMDKIYNKYKLKAVELGIPNSKKEEKIDKEYKKFLKDLQINKGDTNTIIAKALNIVKLIDKFNFPTDNSVVSPENTSDDDSTDNGSLLLSDNVLSTTQSVVVPPLISPPPQSVVVSTVQPTLGTALRAFLPATLLATNTGTNSVTTNLQLMSPLSSAQASTTPDLQSHLPAPSSAQATAQQTNLLPSPQSYLPAPSSAQATAQQTNSQLIPPIILREMYWTDGSRGIVTSDNNLQLYSKDTDTQFDILFDTYGQQYQLYHDGTGISHYRRVSNTAYQPFSSGGNNKRQHRIALQDSNKIKGGNSFDNDKLKARLLNTQKYNNLSKETIEKYRKAKKNEDNKINVINTNNKIEQLSNSIDIYNATNFDGEEYDAELEDLKKLKEASGTEDKLEATKKYDDLLNKQKYYDQTIIKKIYDFENDPKNPIEEFAITFDDRLVFIIVTFFIRYISIIMVQWCIDINIIKTFYEGFIYYAVVYIIIFWFVVLFVNIDNSYDVKYMNFNGIINSIRSLFYYFYMGTSGISRLLIHTLLILLLIFIPIILNIKKKIEIIDDEQNVTIILNNEERKQLSKSLSLFTIFIWLFTSIIATKF